MKAKKSNNKKYFILKSNLIILFILIFPKTIFSQESSNWKNIIIDSIKTNKIENTNNNFDFLINNLIKLKNKSLKKNVNIIHIGDSHIQGEIFTNTIRANFEGYFGKGGVGLNFPYNIAKSNGSSSHLFKSKNIWTSNKLTSINGKKEAGLMGYVIQTKDSIVRINYSFKKDPYSFNKIKLFVKNADSNLKFFIDSLNFKDFMIKDNLCEIKLDNPIESFYIELKSPKDSIANFYGYSMENDNANGIIYNSIGVNGAKFSDFIQTPNFWTQLKNIEADCIILSMGTNEAQNNNLNSFYNDLLTMVSKIKIMYPDAAIIITTPPISYYKKIKLNSNVNLISEIIKKFCLENNISYWDLYCVQEEIDHSVDWKNNKLLRPDLIHYSGDGYRLQANLFINAFQKSWFSYYHN